MFIEELLRLAKELRDASRLAENLGLNDEFALLRRPGDERKLRGDGAMATCYANLLLNSDFHYVTDIPCYFNRFTGVKIFAALF